MSSNKDAPVHFERQPVCCPICGKSSGFHVIYEPWNPCDDPAKLYGAASGIPGTQTLVQCADCSMIFENPRFSPDVIVKGYQASEEGGHDSQYPMRVRSFEAALQRLAAFLPPPGSKILDIGTAGGAFLSAAENFGYEAQGMEPSQYLVEQGKSRGLKIVQGTIESHSLPLGDFDMVCLWDVIEHLPDPRAALEEIRKLLKPTGRLLINFPDIGTWQAKVAGRRFWWILSVHLHHFTRKTIADICRRTGYEVFHYRRYWQILEFGYLERMAVRYRVPMAELLVKLTPQLIQNLPVPYYASQTTALARISR